ncbi:MAG: murein biosynthesis integral membrane protein MurJ [Gammaproteobacteria bacterium]|nr:murein biosynthesis integral membrane protein MurJ [Gammaproteobacteria bacterium]
MKLWRSSLLVSAMTMLSRITGFAREVAIASTFGANQWTDAFNVAFRIPNMFRRLFAEGAFSQAFIPYLASVKHQQGDEGAKQVIDHTANLLLWCLILLTVLGVVGAPLLVWLMAGGFATTQQADLTVELTRWLFPYIALLSLVALSAGILQTWRHFLIPAITPVGLNVCMIIAIYSIPTHTDKSTGIWYLVAGVMAGGICQLGLQIPILTKMRLMPRWDYKLTQLKSAWQSPHTQKMLRLFFPALLGLSVGQISLIINTQIASHLVVGSISWLNYADRLLELPVALMGVAIAVVLTPEMSRAYAMNNTLKYSETLDWGLRLILLLGLPCSLAMVILAKPLVSAVYFYGNFSAVDLHHTSQTLTAYALGLLGAVSIKILAQGFYSRQDVKTPMQVAIITLVFTQLLNLILVSQWSHVGLALSISLGWIFNALALVFMLVRHKSFVLQKFWGLYVLRIGGANVLFASSLIYALQWFPGEYASAWQRWGYLLGVGIAGLSLYAISLWVLGLRLREVLSK